MTLALKTIKMLTEEKRQTFWEGTKYFCKAFLRLNTRNLCNCKEKHRKDHQITEDLNTQFSEELQYELTLKQVGRNGTLV